MSIWMEKPLETYRIAKQLKVSSGVLLIWWRQEAGDVDLGFSLLSDQWTKVSARKLLNEKSPLYTSYQLKVCCIFP